MTPETIQAIYDSIQHWCRMRSDPIGCNEEPYMESCALCKWFYADNCADCPVAKNTGLRHCEGSPWVLAEPVWRIANQTGYAHDILAWHEAANAEIAFLNSLLSQNGAAQ